MIKRTLGLALGAGIVAMMAAPASAATTAAIGSATDTGNDIVVTGTATFEDLPFAEIATDAANDAETIGGPAGGDLVGASLATKTNGDILFRLSVADLPPSGDILPTGTQYIWNFCVDEESCWNLSIQGVGLAGMFDLAPRAQTDYFAAVVDCEDAACETLAFNTVKDDLVVTVDATAKTITVPIPSQVLEAKPGSEITAVESADPAIFTAFGDWWFGWHRWSEVEGNRVGTGDDLADVQAFTVGEKKVSVALTPAGVEPAAGDFVKATLAPNGSFTGKIPQGARAAGEYTATVRACFDADCAVATTPVTVT